MAGTEGQDAEEGTNGDTRGEEHHEWARKDENDGYVDQFIEMLMDLEPMLPVSHKERLWGMTKDTAAHVLMALSMAQVIGEMAADDEFPEARAALWDRVGSTYDRIVESQKSEEQG